MTDFEAFFGDSTFVIIFIFFIIVFFQFLRKNLLPLLEISLNQKMIFRKI